MLTLSQLIALSDKGILQRLSKYRLHGFDIKDHKAETGQLIKLVTALVVGGRKPHNTALHIHSSELNVQSPSRVRCDCQFFTHNLEVALAARGSAYIARSTGEYPRVRNPMLKPGLCSHLFYVATIVSSGQTDRALKAQLAHNAEKKTVQISAQLKNLFKR